MTGQILDREAVVTIDGVLLTPQESATLRCAISSFVMDMHDPEHVRALGPIADSYKKHASRIELILVAACNRGR